MRIRRAGPAAGNGALEGVLIIKSPAKMASNRGENQCSPAGLPWKTGRPSAEGYVRTENKCMQNISH